jgi:cobyrinic acid a,c-diamide synthase
MTQKRNRFVIAGTGSGVGKTTLTIGLMAAFQRRGLKVQGFKCGPDYIDPTYHTAVTGRASRNLDTWMLPHDTMKEIFLKGSAGSDLSVIEGVMGLYDGKDPLSNVGSTAEISVLLESPVILIVNVQSMARSAAAVVLGYQKLDERVRIAGVIVNKCGSEGHYKLVKAAIEQECGVPVIGWLGRDDQLDIPERHLGLVPAIERGELNPLFEHAADLVEKGVDLEAILALAEQAPELDWPEKCLFDRTYSDIESADGESLLSQHSPEDAPTIAVARDAAFNFYYPENLELLEQMGAEIVYFSPLAGESVPVEADGLYIGGGFPEEFAADLAANERAKEDIRHLAQEGLPIFAECGGYMYLTRAITDRAGQTHSMVGLVPAEVKMQSKLAALGYREVTAIKDCVLMDKGDIARGHEFHYSTLTKDEDEYPHVYETKGLRGAGVEGYQADNLMAGYTHLHFASNPKVAARFISKCTEYHQTRRAARGAK